MLKNLPNLSLHMLIDVMLIKEKTCKQKRRFPAYFGYFTHLCAKKSEETNDGISRKCEKTGLSNIFPAISAGKYVFRKSG